ncbi:hypothetical protein KRR40_36725 [Niabella defluvii]|nr:hypothetical protein KRR40_36725 [Niabella sp. I65]
MATQMYFLLMIPKVCVPNAAASAKDGRKGRLFLDKDKSLNEGAVQVPVFATWENAMYQGSGLFDNDKKLRDYSAEEMDLLLYSKPLKVKMAFGGGEMNVTYQGIIEKFTKAFIKRDLKTMSERTQKRVAPYIGLQECPLCKGARLNQAVLNCRIAGKNIAELAALEVTELISILKILMNLSQVLCCIL